MSFVELVKKRRSVRKYLNKSVPRELLDKCLEAARLAPSACNSQPWTFIVVDNEKVKNELVDKALSGVHVLNAFAQKAPVIVVVITERANYASRLGGFFRGAEYNRIDIGIACEHFVLQAAELGLGTCILGWFNEKAIKKILGISADKKIDILITVGYPESDEPVEKFRKSLSEIRKFFN